MFYDAIVIGKGPAGIEAALYIKRSNFNVLVIGKNGGSLEKAEIIDNFYGQEKALSGAELIEKGIEQATRLGVEVVNDEVVAIEYDENGYLVKTLKKEYRTKTITIATGINRKAPVINGIKELEGKGVSYCAICDGAFYKDKEVAVIGDGDYAISEVEALLPNTKKITILTNGKKEILIRDKNIKCNTKQIEKIVGKDKIEKILFKDKSEINVSGVFVAEGVANSLDFAQKLGAEVIEGNLIISEDDMQTTVPGIFAAGDCTGAIYQVAKAVYDGMKAGLGVIKYLKKEI